MGKRNEAFEAFRASNPVDESTVPGPDSPAALALLAEITATPRQQAAQPVRYSRRRVVLAIAVAVLALASIAAAWLILRDVTDPISVVCYEEATLDSNAADVATGGSLDIDLCKPVWEDRRLINEDVAPAGEAPPLVGCVTDQGVLAVFPSNDTALCSRLGLADPDPESISEGNKLRQLDNDVFEYFDQYQCQPIPEAQDDMRRILDSYGLQDWEIRVAPAAPDEPCASYGLDTTNQTLHLVPTPPLD